MDKAEKMARCDTCRYGSHYNTEEGHGHNCIRPGIDNPTGCEMCIGGKFWEPKEVTMDYKAACEAINKVDDSIICSRGKDAVKKIIAALCGEKEEEWFTSSYDAMELERSVGAYKIKNNRTGCICRVDWGVLKLYVSVFDARIRRGKSGSIIVQSPVTVLKSDGTTVEVD